MLKSRLYRSVNRYTDASGPWSLIWQTRTRAVCGRRAISEEDYIRWLLQDVDYEDVVDTDDEGGGLFTQIRNKAIVVYSRKKNTEKPFRRYMKRFADKPCVIIHLSDEFRSNPIDIYKYASLVFRNYARRDVPEHVVAYPLGCTLGKVVPEGYRIKPPSERRYVWSFAGEIDETKSPDRLVAKEVFESLGPSHLRLTSSFEESLRGGLAPEEYGAMLNDSVFALCPSGNRSLDTFRHYEAAMYGAIPLAVGARKALYRTFVRPFAAPFLFSRSWDEARAKVEGLMKEPDRLAAMQRDLLDWWARWPSVFRTHLRLLETA